MKLVLATAAALLASASGAQAAGPADIPSAPARPTRLMAQTGFAGTEETTIAGQVVDKDGAPIDDVTVKLYIGGLLVAEVTTSIDGAFELVELIDYGQDVTIDLWFVPADTNLVMENVLLKESSTAHQHSLYSECVPRVRLDPLTDVIVKLYDIDTRNERLRRQGCVK